MNRKLIPFSNFRKTLVEPYPFSPVRFFNDLKLLKLPEIFELLLLTFLFDSIKKASPSCFHDFFLLSYSVDQYWTRHASSKEQLWIRLEIHSLSRR